LAPGARLVAVSFLHYLLSFVEMRPIKKYSTILEAKKFCFICSTKLTKVN